MPLSYRARLRRDLHAWQEAGLIAPEQAERIAAVALRPPGLGRLQVVLGLCLLLLLSPAGIAFVAANWAAMAPAARLAVLAAAQAAALGVSLAAARRHARAPTEAARRMADGAATLSLVLAAAVLALVGQTFHVAPDPRGFAGTLALLGLATALVARSGGAALIACAALVAADTGLAGLLQADSALAGSAPVRGGWPGFWIVAPGLFAASLVGRLPAREATLFVLLAALTSHLGPSLLGLLPGDGLPGLVSPARILTVAALAMALGHALRSRAPAGLPGTGWAADLRAGGEALTRAAGGLCVLGIVAVCVRTLGLGGVRPGFALVPAFLALAFAAAFLARPWLAGRLSVARTGDGRAPGRLARWLAWASRSDREAGSAGPRPPVSDLLVLAAATLALVAWALGGWGRGASPFWTVWGGIVPALALVAAGHVEERRGLYGWGLTLTAALSLAMLAASRDLIAFSGNLLVCALLVALTLAACRRAGRRITGRAA